VAVETTLIGSKPDLEDEREIERFKDVVDEKWAETDSWASFVAAVQTGSDDLKSDKEPDYQLISIAEARRLGILPIPFAPAGRE
jgi:hypothetical protein